MTDYELDKLARRVMLDAARLEYGGLPEEPHPFSPAFERKMKKLLRRGRHPVWYKALHAAACLLLALLLSGCAVLAVSPEAREAFLGWVRTFHTPEEFRPYYNYTYSGNGETRLPEGVTYRPTWVPEGCRLLDEDHNLPYNTTILFETPEGSFVDFICLVGPATLQVIMDEDDVHKKVQVNGLPADLYLGNNSVIVWNSEDGELLFRIIGDNLSEESLLRMAESVRLTLPRQSPHRPAWHPEEFYLEGSVFDFRELEVHFSNAEGQTIYSYYARPDYVEDMRAKIQEAVAGLTPRTVQVQDDDAELYKGTDNCHLVWPSEDGLYWIYGPVESEIILRIAESMGVEPTAK